MATLSVNGYSNQLTTSNILYLIHLQSIRLFSPKGYSGGHSRLAGQILCTHGSWITLSVCLPHARPSPHAVSKEGTLRSSEHSRGKPDLWLLSSWISVTADAHVMRSNQTPDAGKCCGWRGDAGTWPACYHLTSPSCPPALLCAFFP